MLQVTCVTSNIMLFANYFLSSIKERSSSKHVTHNRFSAVWQIFLRRNPAISVGLHVIGNCTRAKDFPPKILCSRLKLVMRICHTDWFGNVLLFKFTL